MENNNYALRITHFALTLPQCEINFSGEVFAEEILLVSGGRAPSQKFFQAVAQGRKIFAVDKGIETCHENNFLPEILIGDFDSAKKISVDWAIAKKIPAERHPVDKDFTDLQLALELAAKNYKTAIVTGTFGGRADHLFSAIFTCAFSELKTFLADEREIIFFVNGGEVAKIKFTEKPFAISLLSMTEVCDGVSINNVHWQLSGAKIFQKIPSTISNRLEADAIKISVRTGTLAVYFAFAE